MQEEVLETLCLSQDSIEAAGSNDSTVHRSLPARG